MFTPSFRQHLEQLAAKRRCGCACRCHDRPTFATSVSAIQIVKLSSPELLRVSIARLRTLGSGSDRAGTDVKSVRPLFQYSERIIFTFTPPSLSAG